MTVLNETELWDKYKKTGDSLLREKIILKYSSLVKYIAGRIALNMPPHIEFDDLVSYGIFGLIDAIEKFDPDRGIKFKTYAATRIRGAIYDELRVLDWIPRSVRQKAKELEDTYSLIENKLGRSAKDKEVADMMGISLDELNVLIKEVSCTTVISLDDIWHIGDDDDEISISDTVVGTTVSRPETDLEKEEIKKLIIDSIGKLPEREKQIIALYYYEGLTLKEIGKVLSVTESRISQLHTKAILRLKGRLNKLKDILLHQEG